MNSRHPGPRRVLGRFRAAVRAAESRDPGDPGMGSFLRVLGGLLFQNTPGGAPAQCFFDFFMTAPSKTPTFDSILRQNR